MCGVSCLALPSPVPKSSPHGLCFFATKAFWIYETSLAFSQLSFTKVKRILQSLCRLSVAHIHSSDHSIRATPRNEVDQF